MKSYYPLILGQGNIYAKESIAGNFIGIDFQNPQVLTGRQMPLGP